MKNTKLRAALIAGGAFGALSALPYLQVLMACCCAPAIGGGVWAVYLHMRGQSFEQPPYGAGAGLGALTGLVGAVAAAIVGAIVQAAGWAQGTDEILAQLEQLGAQEPQAREFAEGARGLIESLGPLAAALLTLAVTAIVYPIFSMIGGLIGVAVFNKKDA